MFSVPCLNPSKDPVPTAMSPENKETVMGSYKNVSFLLGLRAEMVEVKLDVSLVEEMLKWEKLREFTVKDGRWGR